MKLSAMIFDMDGTLCDTIPVVTQALQETFQTYAGREYTPGDILDMFGPTEEGVIALRVPAQNFPAALQYYIDRYSELHQIANQPFPGVMQLLDMLREREIMIGVVTGKGKNTAAISIETLGIQSYVDGLACGSPNGAEKPDAIRRMLRRWNISPDQAVYVGDMPYDMRAAREAGVLPLGAGWAASATVQETDAQVFYAVPELIEWVARQG